MIPDPGTRRISITVKNKDGVIFEGEAKALTSTNEKGIFDVLPLHENFISVVKEFLRIHKPNGQIQDMRITAGVLKVVENKVNIYVGFEA